MMEPFGPLPEDLAVAHPGRMGARLSACLEGLFPSSVAADVREVRIGSPPTDESDSFVTRDLGPRRAADYAAGRACARAAIKRWGAGAAAMEALPDGAPRWPDGFVGSISHSGGFAAAAVARCEDFDGIGIDLARIRPLDPRMAPRFARASELKWLSSLSAASRPFWTFVLFAAKESLQKCARPVLGFLPPSHSIGVRIEIGSWSIDADVDHAADFSWQGKCGVEQEYLLVATISRRSS